MSATDDPIDDAERQMVEHEIELFRRVFMKISAAARVGPGMPPREQALTEQEVEAAIAKVLVEDPEGLELVRSLAAFHQWRLRQGEAQ